MTIIEMAKIEFIVGDIGIMLFIKTPKKQLTGDRI